jgi:hypothetical protein
MLNPLIFVVKKIKVLCEGRAKGNCFASGFAFKRLTFLLKVENRLKRENLCESFARRKSFLSSQRMFG